MGIVKGWYSPLPWGRIVGDKRDGRLCACYDALEASSARRPNLNAKLAVTADTAGPQTSFVGLLLGTYQKQLDKPKTLSRKLI